MSSNDETPKRLPLGDYGEFRTHPQFAVDAPVQVGEYPHLNENFEAWRDRLTPTYFYSRNEVETMTTAAANASKFKFEYQHDNLVWDCKFSVETLYDISGALRKTLVIRLPNYGYININAKEMIRVVDEEELKDVCNNRHKDTCFFGWDVLKTQVWDELHPFKKFMLDWFGTDADQRRIKQTILYHSETNHIDLCMRHKDSHIGIEFSIEHVYPRANDNDYWKVGFD